MARLVFVTVLLTVVLHLSQGVRSEEELDFLTVTTNQAPEALDGSTLRVREGARLILTCRATDSVGRQVYWYEETTLLETKNHHDARSRSISSALILDLVQSADDGRVLACRADSTTLNKKITLKVQKLKVEAPQMTLTVSPAEALVSEGHVQADLGSRIELKCVLKGGNFAAHHLSWWYDEEQITAVNQLSDATESSLLILDPVVVEDNRKTVTCRADGSTVIRAVTLDIPGVEESSTTKTQPEEISLLDFLKENPVAIQTLILMIALVLGLVFLIVCIITIKALHTYLKLVKKQNMRTQRTPSSSGHQDKKTKKTKKTPVMKQSLKNQILVSAGGVLPQTTRADDRSGNPDQVVVDESTPMNQDRDKDGETNSAFVEEV